MSGDLDSGKSECESATGGISTIVYYPLSAQLLFSYNVRGLENYKCRQLRQDCLLTDRLITSLCEQQKQTIPAQVFKH